MCVLFVIHSCFAWSPPSIFASYTSWIMWVCLYSVWHFWSMAILLYKYSHSDCFYYLCIFRFSIRFDSWFVFSLSFYFSYASDFYFLIIAILFICGSCFDGHSNLISNVFPFNHYQPHFLTATHSNNRDYDMQAKEKYSKTRKISFQNWSLVFMIGHVFLLSTPYRGFGPGSLWLESLAVVVIRCAFSFKKHKNRTWRMYWIATEPISIDDVKINRFSFSKHHYPPKNQNRSLQSSTWFVAQSSWLPECNCITG